MLNMPDICYLKRNEADTEKWNACIDEAKNGLIYGYTFYLDAMCDNWDALVLDDYKVVMPLPWRKKWGFCYLYQPFAVAQLGLFGNALTPELLYEFLKKIPVAFRYWDMPLNFANHFTVAEFPLYERKNFILHLNHPYKDIYANYRQQHRRNIKKAHTLNLVVQKEADVDAAIALAKGHQANVGTETDFTRFKTAYQLLLKKGHAVTYSVMWATGTVLASAVFFFSHHRAYYILPGNRTHGRAAGASHFLIDEFIKDHAGRDLILDFEGSDVPGLQFFYSSFGAVEEPYAAIRHNRLPWFAKWLKAPLPRLLSPKGGT
jgi:hypothetical protein